MARHDNDIQLVRITVLLLSFLTASACDYTSKSTGLPLPSFVADHQREKQKIIDECYERPDAAKQNYVRQWKEERIVRAEDKSVSSVVPQLAKAGCLIRLDNENYNDYYEYISDHLDDGNWEVAATAVSALRGAKGRDSIDHIFRIAKGKHPVVADNAVSALGSRITTSLYDRSLKDDHAYAMTKLLDLCKKPKNVRGLERICEENKVKK